MDEPSFKSFERASITPGNVFRTNIISSITEEESTLQLLSVNRTKDNFGNYIFIIYSKNKDEIEQCLNYLKNLTKIPFKDISIDVTGELNFDDYCKDYIYTFDLTKEEGVLSSDMVFNTVMKNVSEKAGGMVIISDHIDKVPRYLSTMSQLVFIGCDIEQLPRIIHEGGGLPVSNELKYGLKNILCLNKTLLWTKISLV